MPIMITEAWLAGFSEGEGCFSLTKKGFPSYQISQKNEQVLREIEQFITGRGIKCNIYHHSKQVGNYILAASGWRHCLLIYDILRPHMNHPGKITQIERWHSRCKEIESEIKKREWNPSSKNIKMFRSE